MEFAAKDIRQSPQYASYLKRTGWYVTTLNGVNYFIKNTPLGGIIKLQHPGKFSYNDLKLVAAKNNVKCCIFEPNSEISESQLTSLGFRQLKKPFLPTKTILLDIDLPKETLFANLQKDARSILRKRGGMDFKYYKNPQELEEFRKLWKIAIGDKRYIPSLNHLVELQYSFGENSMFLSDVNGESGAIFLKAGQKSSYWQAFTSQEGRRKQIQYNIVWEGILWSKQKRAQVFDFEGIYDSRFPQKSWLGFTHFKKSFGGHEFTYPPAYIKLSLFRGF